ncbi:phosphoglycerate kinase [Aureococcus anophagefferens]|nr:phosphoglycerate kinase [Aureococcus anophagefferens]
MRQRPRRAVAAALLLLRQTAAWTAPNRNQRVAPLRLNFIEHLLGKAEQQTTAADDSPATLGLVEAFLVDASPASRKAYDTFLARPDRPSVDEYLEGDCAGDERLRLEWRAFTNVWRARVVSGSAAAAWAQQDAFEEFGDVYQLLPTAEPLGDGAGAGRGNVAMLERAVDATKTSALRPLVLATRDAGDGGFGNILGPRDDTAADDRQTRWDVFLDPEDATVAAVVGELLNGPVGAAFEELCGGLDAPLRECAAIMKLAILALALSVADAFVAPGAARAGRMVELDAKKSVADMSEADLKGKEGRPEDKFSLGPVSARMAECLGKDVKMAPDCIGDEVAAMEEEKNEAAFVEKLAAPFDLFVNDAFGTAHRAHASTEGVTKFLSPSVSGYLLAKELKYLAGAVDEPVRPLAAIVGGSKVSSKITVLESLINKCDKVIIGGMTFTFLKAMGKPAAMKLAEEKGCELIFPSEILVADKFDAEANTQVVDQDSIPDGWMGLDNGPKATKEIQEKLADCKTVIWNGPMGVFEIDAFAKGTFAICDTLAELTEKGCVTIIGGGDSVAAVEKAGLADKMSHISTGGAPPSSSRASAEVAAKILGFVGWRASSASADGRRRWAAAGYAFAVPGLRAAAGVAPRAAVRAALAVRADHALRRFAGDGVVCDFRGSRTCRASGSLWRNLLSRLRYVACAARTAPAAPALFVVEILAQDWRDSPRTGPRRRVVGARARGLGHGRV